MPWNQEEENLALPSTRAVSGSPRKKIKGKMSPMHATRIEHGTRKKQGTKVECRAKKPRKMIKRVSLPRFEHGPSFWKHCPTLREGRAAFGLMHKSGAPHTNLAHQFSPGSTSVHRNSILAAPHFSALPSARAGQHPMHQAQFWRTNFQFWRTNS